MSAQQYRCEITVSTSTYRGDRDERLVDYAVSGEGADNIEAIKVAAERLHLLEPQVYVETGDIVTEVREMLARFDAEDVEDADDDLSLDQYVALIRDRIDRVPWDRDHFVQIAALAAGAARAVAE